MAIVQIDWQLRYPYGDNPSGFYYWTNTYYLVTPDPMDFPAFVPRVETPMLYGMLHECQANRLLVTSPPHSGTVMENAFSFNHAGNKGSLPTILENVARVHFYIGTEYASYKLLRACIGNSEIEPNGELNATARADLQRDYADGLIANGITNDQGIAFTSAVVQPSIHHWQLRHGTKRRRGVVIAP